MADGFVTSEGGCSLAELLTQRRDWPLRDRLDLVRCLAQQVHSLHQSGRVHRAILIDVVTVDERLRPRLPPLAGSRRFGGNDGDPEFCPPELIGEQGVDVPGTIAAAADALQEAGHSLDPRRIDLYQLGVVLCRLVTGESIPSFIYDASLKGRIAPTVLPLLERALGFDSTERYDNCQAFVESLDDAMKKTERLEAPTQAYETPALGSVILRGNDTPPQGTVRDAPERTTSGLPFERLGHFRIIEQIGGGGMGDVYRGYDESLDRQVAIKVLPATLARDAGFVRRFHAEATAAASLAHPNVVPIYFIGEDAGRHFFAMQYVEGESLAERLHRQGRLAANEALELAAQCLAGLQAAHARGLIHRDVKPGNILIERETSRAMLVDFGLVRRLDGSVRMTSTGIVMGTVDYIAPEQAKGLTVDGRADIYSMGVLLYQLLSGRLPFTADSPTAMVFQHAYEPPFPLKEAVPDAPEPVVELVAHMMAKNPDERHPDCAAVLADVQAVRDGKILPSPFRRGAGGEGGVGAEAVIDDEGSDQSALSAGMAKLLDQTHWQQARDWAATIFRRHAPKVLQELQNTTYQMDAAVAQHQRRCRRMRKLVAEAHDVAEELSDQLEANRAGSATAEACAEASATEHEKQAALAKKQECEENLAALQSQYDHQQEQIDDLEGELAKAEAALAQLESRQQLLKARYQAALARRQIESGQPRPKRRRWGIFAVVTAAVVGLVVLMLILSRSDPSPLPIAPLSPADVFRMPSDLTSLEMVTVGNPGNSPNAAGFGAVDYVYRIGKYDVTAAQYVQFLNAVARKDTYGLYNEKMREPDREMGCDISRSGIPGSYEYHVSPDWANRPVNYVSWGNAARFANWLHNGQREGEQGLNTTEDGAYFLNGAASDAELMTIERKSGARYFLPNIDEWFKAAYHKNDGTTGNYWKYPTRNDETPTNALLDPDVGNSANFLLSPSSATLADRYHRTTVGAFTRSAGPYGTFDQGGNVWQWVESPEGSVWRGLRGGAFNEISKTLASSSKFSTVPSFEGPNIGFRIAAVSNLAASNPEPTTELRYGDFTDVAGLTLNGTASSFVTGSDGTVLRLVPSTKSIGLGRAFSNVKAKVSRFNTSFTFRITDGHLNGDPGKGGDGFAFVIQPVSPSPVNYGTHGMGIPEMKPSVAVEFDIWRNPDRHDPSHCHIGIDINGVVDHGEEVLNAVAVSPNFDGGNKWYAWIDYDGKMLRVWVSQQPQRSTDPVIARPLDIPKILGQDTAHVGFTGGTGAATANHMILSWRFTGRGFPPSNTPAAAANSDGHRSTEPPARLRYDGFSNSVGLTLNGSATCLLSKSDDAVLQLTPPEKGKAGSVFSNARVKASRFSTSFAFRITDRAVPAHGAAGIAFVIQPVSSSSLGAGGGGNGYMGIEPSVEVEFDTFQNDPFQDPGTNHIGINVNGKPDHGVGAPYIANVGPRFYDGNKWYVWIEYDGSVLSVWASQQPQRPVEPSVSRPLDIPGLLGQDTAYVGFTAATGAFYARHSILSWRYAEADAAWRAAVQ